MPEHDEAQEIKTPEETKGILTRISKSFKDFSKKHKYATPLMVSALLLGGIYLSDKIGPCQRQEGVKIVEKQITEPQRELVKPYARLITPDSKVVETVAEKLDYLEDTVEKKDLEMILLSNFKEPVLSHERTLMVDNNKVNLTKPDITINGTGTEYDGIKLTRADVAFLVNSLDKQSSAFLKSGQQIPDLMKKPYIVKAIFDGNKQFASEVFYTSNMAAVPTPVLPTRETPESPTSTVPPTKAPNVVVPSGNMDEDIPPFPGATTQPPSSQVQIPEAPEQPTSPVIPTVLPEKGFPDSPTKEIPIYSQGGTSPVYPISVTPPVTIPVIPGGDMPQIKPEPLEKFIPGLEPKENTYQESPTAPVAQVPKIPDYAQSVTPQINKPIRSSKTLEQPTGSEIVPLDEHGPSTQSKAPEENLTEIQPTPEAGPVAESKPTQETSKNPISRFIQLTNPFKIPDSTPSQAPVAPAQAPRQPVTITKEPSVPVSMPITKPEGLKQTKFITPSGSEISAGYLGTKNVTIGTGGGLVKELPNGVDTKAQARVPLGKSGLFAEAGLGFVNGKGDIYDNFTGIKTGDVNRSQLNTRAGLGFQKSSSNSAFEIGGGFNYGILGTGKINLNLPTGSQENFSEHRDMIGWDATAKLNYRKATLEGTVAGKYNTVTLTDSVNNEFKYNEKELAYGFLGRYSLISKFSPIVGFEDKTTTKDLYFNEEKNNTYLLFGGEIKWTPKMLSRILPLWNFDESKIGVRADVVQYNLGKGKNLVIGGEWQEKKDTDRSIYGGINFVF